MSPWLLIISGSLKGAPQAPLSLLLKNDWVIPGRTSKLQFEINGQNYFLSFVEDERSWYVFAPTATGVNRIPVYVDAPSAEKIVLVDGNQTFTH